MPRKSKKIEQDQGAANVPTTGDGGRRGARALSLAQLPQASEVVPPFTNRGGTMTRQSPSAPGTVVWAGLHWCTFTTMAPLQLVRDTLCEAFGGLVFEDRAAGIWTYHQKAVERTTGAFMAWTEGRLEMAVNLPGEACELLGIEGVLDIHRKLLFQPTRLDFAWDTEGLLTPASVREAHQAGNAVTHSKWHDWRENPEGSTYYIGKRGSDPDARLVRFYDRRGPTRVELEVHKKRAQKLWSQLHQVQDVAKWSSVCLAYLVDFVDFRDRSQDENVGRCERLPWWESFTEGASRLYLPLPRKAPDLNRTREWVEGPVAPSLALIADSMSNPEEWIKKILRAGRVRRSPAQAALLDVTNKIKAATQ